MNVASDCGHRDRECCSGPLVIRFQPTKQVDAMPCDGGGLPCREDVAGTVVPVQARMQADDPIRASTTG